MTRPTSSRTPGVETLVFDPSAFEERAAELRDRVPGLKTLLSLGPSEVGTDLIALAEDLRAAAAGRAGRRPGGGDRPHLHRWHHRQVQGRHADLPQRRDADPDPARRVGVAGGHAVPHRDAAVARRRRVLRADVAARRLHRRASRLRSDRCPRGDPEVQDHRDDAGADDALHPDGPPEDRRLRPVEPRDRLLRRGRDVADAAEGSDRAGSARSSSSSSASPSAA